MAGGYLTALDSDFAILTLLEGVDCEDAPTAVPDMSGALLCCGKRQSVSWDAVPGADTYSLYHRVPALYADWRPAVTATALTAYQYSVPSGERPYTHQWYVITTNECGDGPTATISLGPAFGGPTNIVAAVYTAPECS
jgi:hypothetical protein